MGNGTNHFAEENSTPPPLSPPQTTTTTTTTTTNNSNNTRPIDPETGREIEIESQSSPPIQSPLPPPTSPIPSAPPPSSPTTTSSNTESELPFVTVPNVYISEEDNNNNGFISIDFNTSVVQNNEGNFSYPANGYHPNTTAISLDKPSDNVGYTNEELPFRDPSANSNNSSRNNTRATNNSTIYSHRNTTTTTTNSAHSVRNQGRDGGSCSRRTKFRIISTIISLIICVVVLVIYFGRI